MIANDIKRFIQCLTCGCDINKCNCTEADEDEHGMCKKWIERKEE